MKNTLIPELIKFRPDLEQKFKNATEEDIARALDGLTEKQAFVIRAIFHNRQSYRKVASIHGGSVAAVQRLKETAIQKLVRFLEFDRTELIETEMTLKILNGAMVQLKRLKGDDAVLNFAFNKLRDAYLKVKDVSCLRRL